MIIKIETIIKTVYKKTETYYKAEMILENSETMPRFGSPWDTDKDTAEFNNVFLKKEMVDKIFAMQQDKNLPILNFHADKVAHTEKLTKNNFDEWVDGFILSQFAKIFLKYPNVNVVYGKVNNA